ncbi:MAG TPA: ABC transporter ATP-binding protein [Gemmatimonadales bacterium]
MTTVIETIGLSKRFRRTLAVDAVDFTVEQGQVYGFLGPNGSGKTTTIGMLLGIITPTGGGMQLFGGGSPRDLHHARQRIGATLEQPNFYPYLTGLDNLRIVARVKRQGRKDIDQALDTVGLAGRQRDLFRTYSLGMKQRLALAATMLGDPELVILDEPANGLDPEGMREIRDIITGFAQRGKTVFLSSHLLWEVERTCTHAAVIAKGRILAQGSVKALTSGAARVELAASDLGKLRDAVAAFPSAVSAVVDGNLVVAEISGNDAAALNQYLSGRGIFVSHLAVKQRSLEDAFLALTGAEPHSMGAVA